MHMRRDLAEFDAVALREIVLRIWNEGPHDEGWAAMYIVEEQTRKRLENLLRSEYRTNKELNHALHMADLEAKVKRQSREIRLMQECAEHHNRESYATGLIVRCTGCDAGMPFNGAELTEDRVREVECIASRLRTWFTNHQYRKARTIAISA